MAADQAYRPQYYRQNNVQNDNNYESQQNSAEEGGTTWSPFMSLYHWMPGGVPQPFSGHCRDNYAGI